MSRMNSRTYIVRRSMRAPLSFFPFELRVVQFPIAGQRLRADDEAGVDPAHIDVGFVVLGLIESFEDEGDGGFRHAVDSLQLPRDLAVVTDLGRLRVDRFRGDAPR